MVKDNANKEKFLRIIAAFGLFFDCSAVLNNLQIGTNDETWQKTVLWPLIERIPYLVPAIHIAAIIFGIIYLFMPKRVWLLFVLMVVEASHLVVTGYHSIATFIYASALMLMFVSGQGKTNFKRKIFIVFAYWIVLLSTLFFGENGINEFIFAVCFTCFVSAIYLCAFQMVKEQLGFLIGDYQVPGLDSSIKLPAKGSLLNLKEFGLTERQVACVHFTIDSDYNYKTIAAELITSESTVKKDMQDLYRIFGVKNREMLRLLLLQYKIV